MKVKFVAIQATRYREDDDAAGFDRCGFKTKEGLFGEYEVPDGWVVAAVFQHENTLMLKLESVGEYPR